MGFAFQKSHTSGRIQVYKPSVNNFKQYLTTKDLSTAFAMVGGSTIFNKPL
jgi:hypothetical protein